MLKSAAEESLAALAGEENTEERKISNAIEKGKGFGHFHHTAHNIACAYSVMNKPEQRSNGCKRRQTTVSGATRCSKGIPIWITFDKMRALSRFWRSKSSNGSITRPFCNRWRISGCRQHLKHSGVNYIALLSNDAFTSASTSSFKSSGFVLNIGF